MEEKKKPIVALLYDFDKTLCTQDMQNYAFIPSLGMVPGDFWREANDFGRQERMDGVLAYMYTMIRKCAQLGVPLTRESLVHCGRSIEFFPGVLDWFERINRFGGLLGARPRLQGGEAQVLVVQPQIQPLPPDPPQQVNGRVGGEPVEPGGEPRLPPEGGQGPPRGQKRLLGRVSRVLRIAAHAQGQAVYLVLMQAHQLGEGLLVAPCRGLDQLLNRHGDPS